MSFCSEAQAQFLGSSTESNAGSNIDESQFKSLQDEPEVIKPVTAQPKGDSLGKSPATISNSILGAGQTFGGNIRQITVDGNKRIEKDTILSYVKLKAGDVYSDEKASESIKAIYETGLFADVKIERTEQDVIIKLIENPVIMKVAFEGNKRIDDKQLESEVSSRPRSVFTRSQIQNDVARILDVYRKSGRFSATVEPKIIDRDQNRIDLVFEIDEGNVTKIKQMYFIGNKAFSESKLKEVVRTSEARWYKFFTSDDKYDPDRLNFDHELLRRFYTSKGYADFQVRSSGAELSSERDGFYITYTIEEGEVYKLGDIKIDSKISEVDVAALEKFIEFKKGDVYNSQEVEKAIDAFVKYLGDQGFAFVDVSPKMKRDKENKIIELTLQIGEGPRVYVERINIKGNVRTEDRVIRREFRLAEGDPYNVTKLKRTEQRINNLGYFENVKIKADQGSSEDKAEINVDVSEKSTGEINFGAGYSTVDGLLADVGLRENNLLGRGQIVKIKTTLATERQEIDFGFTEPYFMGYDLATGFDIFSTSLDFRRQSSYDRESQGITLRSSYPWSEELRHTLMYNLRTDDITNIQPFASRFIRDQEGETTTSSIGQAIIYDKRDSKFEPTEGYYFRIMQDLAGFGGDVSFLRNEGNASFYHSWSDKWTLRLAGTGGYVFGFDEDVLIKDRFFVGGSNFRGFNKGGIGPRDRTTGDALGGNIYYVGTIEQSFPLGLPEDLGFLGALFVDVGNLWQLDATGPEIAEADMLRTSIGLGVYWKSPFGPVRIDFAYPIVKDDEDDPENINFSFGTRF